MKRSLLTVIFALFAVVGFSQIAVNVKTGLNLSSFLGDEYEDVGFKPGWRVGVGMEYQFTDLLALQPTLFFSQKGAKEDLGDNASVKFNEWYMELPINLQLRFNLTDNINLLAATGPYLGVGIGGKTSGEASTRASAKVETDTFGDDAFRRFDAGWGLGIGVEINRFQVGIDTQFGFCKLMDADGAPHNVNIGIMVGYTF